MASTLLWGLVGSLAHMSFFYLIYRYHKVITVVDLGWCAGFLFLIFLYLICSPSSLTTCSFFFILCVLAWALRLAHHLEKRLEVVGEDRRYIELISGWTAHKELYIFFFHIHASGLFALSSSASSLLHYYFSSDMEYSNYNFFSLVDNRIFYTNRGRQAVGCSLSKK